MYARGKGYARGTGDLEHDGGGMPWIGTLKDRKLADPSLRFPHLAIAKRPNPLGGGASDSDAPYLGWLVTNQNMYTSVGPSVAH